MGSCSCGNVTDMTHYEIRDIDMPGSDPLAAAADYEEALRVVADLHQAFHRQLDANGEGTDTLVQRLSISAVSADGVLTITRALSTVSGYH